MIHYNEFLVLLIGRNFKNLKIRIQYSGQTGGFGFGFGLRSTQKFTDFSNSGQENRVQNSEFSSGFGSSF